MSVYPSVTKSVFRSVHKSLKVPAALLGGGGIPAFSPLDLLPVVWLSASNLFSDAGTTPAVADGTVYRIGDISGNNRYSEQTTEAKRPLLKVVDGKDCWRLDGTDDITSSVSFSLSQPMTVYCVASVAATGAGRWWDANTVNGAVMMNTGAAFTRGLFAGSTVAPSSLASTVPDVYAAIYNGASSIIECGYRNKATGNPGSAGWSNGFCLGGAGSGTGGFYRAGDFYHVIAFSGSHDFATRNLMREYFKSQFNQKPYIRCLGDSLTFGTGSTGGGDYPAQMVGLLTGGSGSYELSNAGSSGITIASISGTGGASVATTNAGQYCSALRKNVCIIWAGTNDLLAGTSAADVYTHLANAWAAARAAGFKVVTATTIARGNFDATQESRRDSLNTLIRSDDSLYDSLADLAALPQFDAQSDSSNTTYYEGDTVHLNNAGYAIVAAEFAASVTDVLAMPHTSLSS